MADGSGDRQSGLGVFAPSPFDIQVARSSDELIQVSVAGDLDLATSPSLQHRVEAVDGDASTAIVDLSDVTFMDSTGLRALWTLRQAFAASGGRMLLASPSDAVLRVLKLTKLDKVFEYADGEQAAD